MIRNLLINTKKIAHFYLRRQLSSCGSHEEVLQFWFGGRLNQKLWFGGGPEQDMLIKDKFGDLVTKARNGELSSWENLELGDKGGLAFIILLDQFCRNIYRGTADMFTHDHKAREVASKIVNGGKYKELTLAERAFLNLPFEHAESDELQTKSVAFFTELVTDAKGTEFEEVAKEWLKDTIQHKEVIGEYGRFPNRNKAMGRENTKKENEVFFKENKYTF